MTESDYPPETKPAQIQEFFSPDREKKLMVARGLPFVPPNHPLPLIKDLPPGKINISETVYPFLESVKRIMANQAQEKDFHLPQIKVR